MAAGGSATASRRWLAQELRRLRENNRLSQKDAAQSCGWSGARLSYLETDARPVLAEDLDVLLPLYGVPEADRKEYYEAVSRTKAPGWWERYEHLVPDWAPPYLGFEQGAAKIRTFESLLVPGILQSEGYTAAIMRGGLRRRSEREIARLVELRVARQTILTRPDEPTQLEAIIDESILYRSPGEPDGPGVLGPQLEHLERMAKRPNVTLRIVPFDGGLQSFSTGPFSILSFPADQPDPLVFLEHRGGSLWLDDSDSVARFELAFEGILERALDSRSSLATVRGTIERYARQ